jgi:hypothetical protein
MKIIKIERLSKTKEEDYTLITFRTWYGTNIVKKCITPNWNLHTFYADNGKDIPIALWVVVKAFLKTEDNIHNY